MNAKAASWLLLVHQIPPTPGYLRVKIRRRLRRLGAVAIKSTVYALPSSDRAREDFEWVLREIEGSGGEAVLCEARLLGGLSDKQAKDLFRAARDAEYAGIARDAEEIARTATASPAEESSLAEAARARLARLRRRLAQVTDLDFFDASGRAAAELGLAAAATTIARAAEAPSHNELPSLEALRGRVWVTRRGVYVDRMASAWLIRRFIDPEARFRLVEPDGYSPEKGEIRFDMFEAEFTHEGDLCTFEVLAARAAPDDRALAQIAEIVHDIDLRDGKFAREDAVGIERLIAGIRSAHDDDDTRIARASALFDDLYEYFTTK
ncbi:MAG: chromate resistance protein ChrB domain-containing protein [Gemmatimonadota bacterium]